MSVAVVRRIGALGAQQTVSGVWRLDFLTYREPDIGAADSATQMRSRDLVAFMAPMGPALAQHT
jgi:hypothetical protein